MTVKIRTRKPNSAGEAPAEVKIEKAKAEEKHINPDKNLIILLEDSPPNRNILKAILIKLGFEILEGDSGKAGLQFMERCKKENLKLVAFISDIMMPEMDGLTFLGKVRAHETYKDLPFLLVTAAADKDNVIEAGKLGVTGYLLKPVTMEQIRTKLQEVFPDIEFPSLRQMQKAS